MGEVTSGTVGPTLQKSIAMAYVASPSTELEGRLDVEIRARRVGATVVKLPFVPHHTRPREPKQ